MTRSFEAKVRGLVGQMSAAAIEPQATARSMIQAAGETTQQATSAAAQQAGVNVDVQTVA
jgi:methyl-accepting chemotaxis protein